MATQNNKDHGFSFQLTVNQIDSIKPRQSGSSEIDGQTITWGHAVKIKVRNIDLVEDKDFGIKEVETTLEIEIPCDTMSETVELNKFLQGLKVDGKPFELQTTLPTRNNSDYSCKSLLTGSSFLSSYK